MNVMPPRMVVYTKDVQNITGFSSKASSKYLRTIRKQLGKPPGSFVTIHEFSQFSGINYEHLLPYLN